LTTVTLVYPYFHPRFDNSIFRFPPIGLGYIAAYLKQNGVSVEIVDCTFLTQQQAIQRIIETNPTIIGIQSMYSMRDVSIELARKLRQNCSLLVAGGALPTISPEQFFPDFDIVVLGEGEHTMLEVTNQYTNGASLTSINGIAYQEKETGQIKHTPQTINMQPRFTATTLSGAF
jgi:anaerobic magnesium-protoporphyrin IX monomethyl ester cyclase